MTRVSTAIPRLPAARVAFHGHDLHGLTLGPDGMIYFTVGDRGYHVVHEGRTLADPESGAVFRCEPDGSRLEVVHAGLRNPQELAFDDLGNLFTVDNNSDSGDRARLVQIVPGGDSGWRMSVQYLPDRGPFNRERIWHLAHDGQPAWIVPTPPSAEAAAAAGRRARPCAGRRGDPAIAGLLDDADPRIVLEAARAIHDVPIPAAFASLAERLDAPLIDDPDGDALLRRSIAACERSGTAADAARLARFAARPDAPPDRRIEAVAVLRDWSGPPSLDRVLGMWRPFPEPREPAVARQAIQRELPQILAAAGDRNPADEKLRTAVLDAAAAVGVPGVGTLLAAVCVKPATTEPQLREQQAAIDLLAALDVPTAEKTVAQLAARLAAGRLDPRLALEVIEARDA
jgi:hypothetical protein